MVEDRVIKFLKELSGELWKLSKQLDELSKDIETFIEVYEDVHDKDDKFQLRSKR